jgi:hypothetical protein
MNRLESLVPRTCPSKRRSGTRRVGYLLKILTAQAADRPVPCEPKTYDSGIVRRSIKVSVYRDWVFGDDRDGS